MRSARWLGVKDVLAAPRWPAEWPYSSVDFSRQDETNDSDFYSFPRFCYHIDERAVGALTAYYDKVFGEWQEPAVLDLHERGFNENPSLPFGDAEFDIVTNAVSVDYLTRPLEVCREVERVLKPGGAALFALFEPLLPEQGDPDLAPTNDLEHVFIAGSFFH
ncbi:hypothetical protein CTAYLR_003491 [Chrysophaeum taylorii]|uniref:Methyltransferase type 11 domain-containing protein n=1 Tax=Chrysophaeum taylorii TaxID=2483200 RepID=A0AAD7XKY7_9STRA|nr:hypothetical protein CTAYLR_003491 [Chrysophaeum taylorii]